jgi:magnesium transporter
MGNGSRNHPAGSDGSSGHGRRGFTRPLVMPGRRVRYGTGGPAASEAPPPATRDLEAVIGDCAVYGPGGRRPGRLPLDAAAKAAHASDGFVWIGLQQPTAEEFEEIAGEFQLPALAVEDAVCAHQRPKLEVYGDVVFAVLKPVRYVDHNEVVDVSEVAVFLGAHFVVTVRHGISSVLAEVRKELDRAGPELLSYGPAGVLYRAADRIVDEYENAIAQISEDVEEIEVQVFSGDDAEHAQRIYKLKREVLEFRRAVAPLSLPLQHLADGAIAGIAPAVTPYFRDVHDHLLRATDALDGQDRMLTDVLNADLASVTARQSRTAVRQNEDMRKISAWAAIALVPTAIAGIYGMNFDNMPELKWKYGYFLILGVIFTICIGLHRLFHRNGWL